MTPSLFSERIERAPIGGKLCSLFTTMLLDSKSEVDFLRSALKTASTELNAQLAIVRAIRGTWRILSQQGKFEKLPEDLLAEVLDSQEPRILGPHQAVLLDLQTLSGEILLANQMDPLDIRKLDATAAALGQTLLLFRHQAQLQSRCERLGAMLEMTQSWSQSRETASLLQAMAETSTSLLNAERATIFLWDKSAKELIGRPALGIEHGELRIPEDSGIVGQVIKSGEPRRVDHDVASELNQIDRATDRKLDFETRSLLCIPLRDSGRHIIGAFELINKRTGNFSDADHVALEELASHAAVAIENTKYLEQVDSTRKQIADAAADKVQLIGQSEAIQQVITTINRLAPTDLAVLILGENGTGKEVVAELIHYQSLRRNNVMVAVNCAAIAETLLESELFGHEQGAFTDAREMRKGKFELADNGTLFLDEIGDMIPGGQSKLLRVLEDKVVVRIGGSIPISTDVRVIAATNQDLESAVASKQFRQDLYFRLNVVTIQLPPLRERGDDVLLLAEYFLKQFSIRARRKLPQFTTAAKKRLLGYHWPGNVRELRNQMERLSYLHIGDKIDVNDLVLLGSKQAEPSGIPMGLPLTDASRMFQCEYIDQHIRRVGGNMTEAAENLGLHRSNLYRKMKQLGMEINDLE